MKIVITPKEVIKQIEFDDIESYWFDQMDYTLHMTKNNGDKVVYVAMRDVEYYVVEND